MILSTIARIADRLQKTAMMALFRPRIIVGLLLLVIAAGLVFRSGNSGYVEFVEGDYEAAAVNLGQRAADGDMVAATIAGDLHSGFSGITQQVCLARSLYKIAADAGDPIARVRYIAMAARFDVGESGCKWISRSLKSFIGRSGGTAEAMLVVTEVGDACSSLSLQEQLIYLRMAQFQGLIAFGDEVDRLGNLSEFSTDSGIAEEVISRLQQATESTPVDWGSVLDSEPDWPCSSEQTGPKAPSK